MRPLVTIAIPVYKRLDYLPHTLRAVDAQDYAAIELIVSDNGMNGPELQELVRAHYSKPFRLRANPTSVPVVEHFNQVLHEAEGKYFVLLCDDDEISPEFVSELAALLERYPQAVTAIPLSGTIDAAGQTLSEQKRVPPELLAADDFIRSWTRNEYGWTNFTTRLSRTDALIRSGGFPAFPRALHSDSALLLKILLGRYVALGQRATFRWRIHDSNLGYSLPYREAGTACKQFLRFLDTDADIRRYAVDNKRSWAKAKAQVVDVTLKYHFGEWAEYYHGSLTHWEWVKAAFAMPFVRGYYTQVGTLLAWRSAVTVFKALFPQTYRRYKVRTQNSL